MRRRRREGGGCVDVCEGVDKEIDGFGWRSR